MTDIRRTLLWVVFVTSLVMLWDAWNKQQGHPSMFGVPLKPAATASAPAGAASAGVPTAAAGGTASALPSSAAAPAAGEKVTVTTDVVKATFDTLGGSLVRLELLKHRQLPVQPWYAPFLQAVGASPKPEPQNVVIFDRSNGRDYVAQTGLVTTQAGVTLPTHLTPMAVVPGARELADGSNEVAIRFESAAVDGRKLAKTFTFKRGDYTYAVKHEVINEGSTPVTPSLYLQLARDGAAPAGESSFYFTFTGPAIYTDANKFHKIDFKDIEKGKAEHDKTANDGWIAMVQHYFASAWLVPGAGPREFRTSKVRDNFYAVAMVMPLGEVAPGTTKAHEALLFAGPQEEKKLAALAPGLELVKDYGWFTVLAKPLFWLLDKLHGLLGNWGWSIVALVVLLKIAFYWLNASAYKSMAKMRAVNPKVMELRERHKDNPQQMQQEMMRIYREEKVNPLGGCLPIVAQMPFFIALYWVLLSSVEMRAAPWVGWIHDLALPDPLFILPLLMTLSSLVQVALGAKPPDPMQARMMWIMPLAFSFMFFFFPAGLVLYWLTNNILSIAQQWFINKRMGVDKV